VERKVNDKSGEAGTVGLETRAPLNLDDNMLDDGRRRISRCSENMSSN
jgi:hypothetical protein